MTTKQFLTDYLNSTLKAIEDIDKDALIKATLFLDKAYTTKKTIFVIGNGGSASTASHFAVDLAKTVRGHKGDAKWLGFKVNSLSDNAGLITAWANDVGYEKVYSGQLENLGQKGDVLVAISSSGNSENILDCTKLAKRLGMKTIGISGFGGGKLKSIVDVALVCREQSYGPVEDIQLILNHAITNFFIAKFKQDYAKA